VLQVPDLGRLAKLLRIWLGAPAGAGTIALLTLCTDYPEVNGLLTSLSSVVFTVATVASMVVVMFVGVAVDRNAKRGLPGHGIQVAFLR
jgi:Na+/melibiose symporter-like transporter